MQVTVFIKACKEQIDVLKNSINNEEENSKGWLGIRSDSSNADTIAHKHGVVWLVYLHFLISIIMLSPCFIVAAVVIV